MTRRRMLSACENSSNLITSAYFVGAQDLARLSDIVDYLRAKGRRHRRRAYACMPDDLRESAKSLLRTMNSPLYTTDRSMTAYFAAAYLNRLKQGSEGWRRRARGRRKVAWYATRVAPESTVAEAMEEVINARRRIRGWIKHRGRDYDPCLNLNLRGERPIEVPCETFSPYPLEVPPMGPTVDGYDDEFYSFYLDDTDLQEAAPDALRRYRYRCTPRRNRAHFSRFLTPRFTHPDLPGYVVEAIGEFANRGIPIFPCPTSRHVRAYGLNPRAYAGVVCAAVTGYLKKDKPKLYAIAEKWYTEPVLPLRSIYRAGGREKVQDVSDNPKTRLILMEDAICGLISQPFAKPVADYLERKMCEVFMGHSFFHGRYNQFLTYMRGCRWYAMWDWGGFDSRVNHTILCGALTMFRNFFEPAAWDRFDAIAHNFVSKIVAYGNKLFAFSSGIPSGHSWTSLVGTMCNYIMTRSVLHAMYGRRAARSARISVCGDDVFVGMGADVPLPDGDVLAAIATVLFRGVVKEGSFAISLTLDGPDARGMSFLAHGFQQGKPVRWAPEVVDSLLLPQSYPRSKEDRLAVAMAFVMDTPWGYSEMPWLSRWLYRCFIGNGGRHVDFKEFERTLLCDAMSLSDDKDSLVPIAIVPENLRIFSVRTVIPDGVQNATTAITMRWWTLHRMPDGPR